MDTMAYLNREEREALARELTTMSAGKARGKLRRMDPNSRLRYLRNAQQTGEYLTSLDLPGRGVIVTLVEREVEKQTFSDKPGAAPIRLKPDFSLEQVIVDRKPENNT
jgi:hypothetical protein